MSKIINLFGGPGIGKSTQASGLFTEMKRNHMSVEYTYEFPKEVAWEGNISQLRDQFFITANQHRNISRLYGKVDYIIVDSEDSVITSSETVANIGLIKGSRITSENIRKIIRNARKRNEVIETEVAIPRGSLTNGFHERRVRIAQIGRDGNVAVLIFVETRI